MVVEMALQAGELALHVVAQRRRDVDLLAVGIDAHRLPPSVWRQHRADAVGRGECDARSVAVQPMRTRSCEDGMLIASRYFATVRRATGTPPALRRSARRASDKGLRGFSASINVRIMLW